MSSTRNNKRKKARNTGIEKDKQNPAGYYKGMPGVFTDKHGNRRIYEISQLPSGEIQSSMGCMPQQIVTCMAVLMKADPMTAQMMQGAIKRYKREYASPFMKWIYSIQAKLKKATDFKAWKEKTKIAREEKKKLATEGMSPEEYDKYVEKMKRDVDRKNKAEGKTDEDIKAEISKVNDFKVVK